MSRPLTKLCVDDVLYWSPIGDGPLETGFWQMEKPEQLKGRWEDIEEEFVLADGSTQVSKAQVLVLVDLDTDGWLRYGKIADLDDQFTTSPWDFPDAWPIKKFERVPKGKKRLDSSNPDHVFRMAYLGSNRGG